MNLVVELSVKVKITEGQLEQRKTSRELVAALTKLAAHPCIAFILKEVLKKS